MTTQRLRPLTALAIACLTLAAGCQTPGAPVGPTGTRKPSTPRSASPRPTLAPPTGALAHLAGLERLVVPQADLAAAVSLSGKAKVIANNAAGLIANNGGGIISDNGGSLISNNGGGIISDNGGSIISNNSGAIISDNGGSLIANNGGGLVSQTKYALQATDLAEFRLADAALSFHDAQGRVLVDDAGKPLTATTGKDGGYALKAVLPKGNLVAKIRLAGGGDLTAMVVRDGAGAITLDLDTASTMGTSYVLGRYVTGDQAIFDKLPRAEAERLTRDLGVVRGYLTGAFKYDAELLTEATDALRAKERTVDKTLDDVKALLLGQASLGAGLPATQVPLGSPTGVLVDRQGRLVIGEEFSGRVRLVDKAGTLTTLADAAFGTIKRNFLSLLDMAELPDGSLLVASRRADKVYRLTGATFEEWAGMGTNAGTRGAVKGKLDTVMFPRRLAVAADGTVYIGEDFGGMMGSGGAGPRVYAVSPDGTFRRVNETDLGANDVLGVATGPAGAVYALVGIPGTGESGTLMQVAPGAARTIATGLALGDHTKLQYRASDAALVFTEPEKGRVVSVPAAGGALTVLAGTGGPAGLQGLISPGTVHLAPDGAVYVADHATNLVHRIGADGKMSVVAGSDGAVVTGDQTSFAINGPGGATFDAAGNLYIAEGGSHTIKKFDGKTLSVFAGTVKGLAGDGGPARNARFSSPTGLGWRDGNLWVMDNGNRRLRMIDAAGTVTTKMGATADVDFLQAGQRTPALGFMPDGTPSMILDPAGRPVFACGTLQQIFRFLPGEGGAPDQVEALVGKEQLTRFTAPTAEDLQGTNEPDAHAISLRFPLGLAYDPKAAEPTLAFSETGAFAVRRATALEGGHPRLQQSAGKAFLAASLEAATFPAGAPIPDGEGRQALDLFLALPTGLAYDADGNLYVAEAGTASVPSMSALIGSQFPFDLSALPVLPARVRRIGRDGVVTNIAGPGGRYFTDPAAPDALVFPTTLVVAPDGRLVIVDSGANQVRILPVSGLKP